MGLIGGITDMLNPAKMLGNLTEMFNPLGMAGGMINDVFQPLMGMGDNLFGFADQLTNFIPQEWEECPEWAAWASCPRI